MLKNFMQNNHSSTETKPAGNTRTDSGRTNQSAYEDSATPIEKPQPEKMSSQPNEDGNKLIVGPNIKLKGSEITDCEILVVEGRVEASMNSRDIRIAEGGVFSGKAEIDVAEVRGHFEGELTARKRLVIYSTGKVSGVIRYGALMVEEGGSISGDVATISETAGKNKVSEIASQAATPATTAEETSRREPPPYVSTLARNPMGKRQG